MLKHIPTGQPSSAGSRNHHHNDYNTQTISGALHHQHFGSGSTTTAASPRVVPRLYNDSSIYDSLVHPVPKINNQQTPTSIHHHHHHHPLNHSQLSVNLSSRQINHSHPLNLSTLSTSKHSIDSASPGNEIILHHGNPNHSSLHHHLFNHNNHSQSITNHLTNDRRCQIQANGGLDISRLSRLPSRATPSPAPVHAPVSQPTQVTTVCNSSPNQPVNGQDISWTSFCLKTGLNGINKNQEAGVKEMLTFLGLLCLVSLLLAMLSHIFLLKISPVSAVSSSLISPEEYTIVYEVTLALCALALSLNLCCLLVCAIQFLFAMKLVKSSYNQTRTNMYLQKSSVSRMCAVGGFFISIPVFLTGMILYTFIQFRSTPAIIMSVLIGLGILFCGCAMVHNVFVWQREKTNAVKELARAQCEAAAQLRHQQLQQQQQQQVQPQPQQSGTMPHRPLTSSTIPRGNCTAKVANSTLPHCPRGQYHPQYKHHEQSRHTQMSPALLTLSASPAANNRSSIDVHRGPISPSATPAGDHSPTSPLNKTLNRSHHLQHEACGSVSPGLPPATLDLSSAANTNSPHELSTLV